MALTEIPRPRDSLVPFLADYHLPYIVPALVYWILGCSFHYLEKTTFLSKYKIHTPAESLKKDRATKKDVIKFALLQQAAQLSIGYWSADRNELFYTDAYYIERLVGKLNGLQQVVEISTYLPIHGVNSLFFASSYPTQVSNITFTPFLSENVSPTEWQWKMASMIYWVLIPGLQFIFAMALADTFQYFTHRAFHVNRWLYKNIHSMHHDVFVPFAYGAFYNHPLETIPVDSIGLPCCLAIACLNNRQAALFSAIWTYKTVIDHCGYTFPWNPANIICGDSVLFHDLHHQSWGMKYNFSVYTSFWDRMFGTFWDGKNEMAVDKYRKGKEKAQIELKNKGVEGSTGGVSTALEDCN